MAAGFSPAISSTGRRRTRSRFSTSGPRLRAEPPIKLLETYHTKGGNLVAGDGYLIVAQADGMVVFCQNSRLIERYQRRDRPGPRPGRQLFPARPGGRGHRPRPARARDVPRPPQKARSSETIDGVSWSGAARDHRFRLLLRLAVRDRKSRRWDVASAQLKRPPQVARSDPERLQAQLLLADVLARCGTAARSRRNLRAAPERRTAAPAGGCRRRRASHHPRRSLISPIA